MVKELPLHVAEEMLRELDADSDNLGPAQIEYLSGIYRQISGACSRLGESR